MRLFPIEQSLRQPARVSTHAGDLAPTERPFNVLKLRDIPKRNRVNHAEDPLAPVTCKFCHVEVAQFRGPSACNQVPQTA
jgi:hypothetical protein